MREIIAHGDIVVSKVGTQDNPTNMMTKVAFVFLLNAEAK